MVSRIIRYLGLLNRKERFHLLQAVLTGGPSGDDSFRLSSRFRLDLGRVLGLTVPDDAFAAMDYQLDWIYVALYLAIHDLEPETAGLRPKPGDWFNHDQEDTDLLAAFECPEHPNACQLVLVEAKCETGWTNEQVQSKLCRLQHIHDELQLADHPEVQFHWVVTSPTRSKGLSPSWPPWLRWGTDGGAYHWLQMPVGRHWRAERCGAHGRPSKRGAFWQLKQR